MCGAEQRDHHRSVGRQVAGQADVEQREPVPAVAVIDPVLRGELDRSRAIDRPEGDLVRALAVLDRRREERLVANVLLLVDQPGRDLDPAQPVVEPDRRRELAGAERAGDLELGEDRTE